MRPKNTFRHAFKLYTKDCFLEDITSKKQKFFKHQFLQLDIAKAFINICHFEKFRFILSYYRVIHDLRRPYETHPANYDKSKVSNYNQMILTSGFILKI